MSSLEDIIQNENAKEINQNGITLNQQSPIDVTSPYTYKTKKAFSYVCASLPRRICAYILDSIFIYILAIGYSYLFYHVLNIHSDPFTDLIIKVHFTCFIIFLFGVLESSLKGSLGKRILGIYVLTDEGEAMSLTRSFFRSTFKFAFTGFGFINLFLFFTNEKHKFLHDYMVSSLVVQDFRYDE